LRAANGMVMDNQGSAEMELRLPGSHLSDPPIAVHRFEVLGDKAMPPSLQILGVDFWDQLNPQTDWKRRTINCCNKEGVEFQLEFDVGTVDNRDRDQHTVHAVQGDRKADQSERGSGASQERFELYAATDVHLRRGERALIDLVYQKGKELKARGRHITLQSHIGAVLWSGPQVDINESEQCIKYFVQNGIQEETYHIRAGSCIASALIHEDLEDYLASDAAMTDLPEWIAEESVGLQSRHRASRQNQEPTANQ
jgi:hypothetical protein